MDTKRKIWNYFDKWYKVYSENKELIETLCKEFNVEITAKYSKDGKEYAWDVIIPIESIKKAKKLIKNKFD